MLRINKIKLAIREELNNLAANTMDLSNSPEDIEILRTGSEESVTIPSGSVRPFRCNSRSGGQLVVDIP